MEATASVAGIVVDRDGHPVPGAAIRAWETVAEKKVERPRAFSSARERAATSDPDGRFLVPHLVPKHTIQLYVETDDHLPRLVAIPSVAPGEHRDGVCVVVERGPEVAIRIRDRHGDPIAGLEVEVWALDFLGRALGADPARPVLVNGTVAQYTVDTDESGAARFKSLPAGHVQVRVRSPRPFVLDPEFTGEIAVDAMSGARADLTLYDDLILLGRVEDEDGGPVARATLTFRTECDTVTGRTNGKGEFACPVRRDAPYGVVAVVVGRATEGRTPIASPTVTPNGARVTIVVR